MTYFADGSPYTYRPEFEDGSVNIGWLDESIAYPKGDVPLNAVERLIDLCRDSINRTRGWHVCNLCPPAGPIPSPTMTSSSSGDFPVGFGEIRVEGGDGVRYAAPDMIAHYIIEHHYRPPSEFLEALGMAEEAAERRE